MRVSVRYMALCYDTERSERAARIATRIAFPTRRIRSTFDNIYVTNKYYKMSEEELELLCQEDEVYVQAWRSSLTQEQLNQLNEYIA
jgi:hypothetical protein